MAGEDTTPPTLGVDELPPQASAALLAVQREAPEYTGAFARFLVERVCGLAWIEPEPISDVEGA